MNTARAGFGAVVAAAVVSGFALVVFPDSTGQFFSWGLGPPPLASLVGGLYLASALTFAVALWLPWRGIRSLLAASVVLTAPTLLLTFVHLDVFDLSRWQAWAWIALFAAAPPFWAGLLSTARRHALAARRPAGRNVFLVVAVLLAAGAIAMWIDPATGSPAFPFELAGLGGRFVGAWLGFMAVMAAWFALRPGESLLPAVALTAYPAGALAAGLRSFGDLTAPPPPLAYLVALALLTAAGVVAFGLRAPRET